MAPAKKAYKKPPKQTPGKRRQEFLNGLAKASQRAAPGGAKKVLPEARVSEADLAKVRMVTVDADRAGQRLDNFLIGQLKGAPKSLVYRIVRKGEVRVNKGRSKPDYKLQAGDLVRVPPVRLPAPNDVPAVGEGLSQVLKAAILYESDGLLIVNKPSGLAVHGGSGVNLGLIESLRQVFPDYRFLELVHRLDKDTSGCVMVAKKRSTLKVIQDQLRARGGINKVYHALVGGHWPAQCKQVNAPLLRYSLQSGERMVKVDEEGKPSITRYRILQTYDQLSLIEAKPVTGRTHQIRVHCQYMGHPIVGDDKYGDERVDQQQRQQGLKRLFLHAAELHLTDPSTEQVVHVEAPYDAALAQAIRRLSK